MEVQRGRVGVKQICFLPLFYFLLVFVFLHFLEAFFLPTHSCCFIPVFKFHIVFYTEQAEYNMSLFVFVLCAVQWAIKHSDVWYITPFIIRAQSLIPAFNLFITKLTDPCLKQAIIWSVHQHAHFTPSSTNPLNQQQQKPVKNTGTQFLVLAPGERVISGFQSCTWESDSDH